MSEIRTAHELAVDHARMSIASADIHLRDAEERHRIRAENPHADAGSLWALERGVDAARLSLAAARLTLEALEGTDALRADLARVEAERDELRRDYNEEVEQFNAGFEAARRGEPRSAGDFIDWVSEHGHRTDHDAWATGWTWATYGDSAAALVIAQSPEGKNE